MNNHKSFQLDLINCSRDMGGTARGFNIVPMFSAFRKNPIKKSTVQYFLMWFALNVIKHLPLSFV
jgi:hypothetical protein